MTSDRLYRGSLGVTLPPMGSCCFNMSGEFTRARSLDNQQFYRFAGANLATTLPGFWRITHFDANISVGLKSDIEGLKGVGGSIGARFQF